MAMRAVRVLKRFALRGGPTWLPGETAGFEEELAMWMVDHGVAAWVDEVPVAMPVPPPASVAAPDAPPVHTMVAGARPKWKHR